MTASEVQTGAGKASWGGKVVLLLLLLQEGASWDPSDSMGQGRWPIPVGWSRPNACSSAVRTWDEEISVQSHHLHTGSEMTQIQHSDPLKPLSVAVRFEDVPRPGHRWWPHLAGTRVLMGIAFFWETCYATFAWAGTPILPSGNQWRKDKRINMSKTLKQNKTFWL